MSLEKMAHPIHNSITPILVVCAILGAQTLDSSHGRIWQVASYLYSIFCIAGFCLLTRLTLMNQQHFCLAASLKDGYVMGRVLLYSHLFITICTILCAWARNKPMRDIVSLHHRCDDALERIGVSRDYRKIYVHQGWMLAILMTAVFIFGAINCKWLILDNTSFEISIVLILTIQYPITVIDVIDMNFLYWVRCVGLKFGHLNTQLQSMLTTSTDSPQHKRVVTMMNTWSGNIPVNSLTSGRTGFICRTKENSALMKAAKKIHLDLTKVGRMTSDAFGTHLLLSMTSSFTLVTSLLYYGYIIFWKPLQPDIYEREMVTLCFWIILFAFKILIVSHICALASAEAANTGDIICELYEPSTSSEFRTEIREFTLQMIQNPLTFTAHGFFDLDHTFIHATIASITTYLVILIQVGDATDDTFKNSTGTPNDSVSRNISLSVTDLNLIGFNMNN